MMRTLVTLANLLLSPLSVSAHSNIVWPHTWFDKGGVLGINYRRFETIKLNLNHKIVLNILSTALTLEVQE